MRHLVERVLELTEAEQAAADAVAEAAAAGAHRTTVKRGARAAELNLATRTLC